MFEKVATKEAANPPKIVEFSMTLEQAQAISDVLAHVGGDMRKSRRRHIDQVWAALLTVPGIVNHTNNSKTRYTAPDLSGDTISFRITRETMDD